MARMAKVANINTNDDADELDEAHRADDAGLLDWRLILFALDDAGLLSAGVATNGDDINELIFAIMRACLLICLVKLENGSCECAVSTQFFRLLACRLLIADCCLLNAQFSSDTFVQSNKRLIYWHTMRRSLHLHECVFCILHYMLRRCQNQ